MHICPFEPKCEGYSKLFKWSFAQRISVVGTELLDSCQRFYWGWPKRNRVCLWCFWKQLSYQTMVFKKPTFPPSDAWTPTTISTKQSNLTKTSFFVCVRESKENVSTHVPKKRLLFFEKWSTHTASPWDKNKTTLLVLRVTRITKWKIMKDHHNSVPTSSLFFSTATTFVGKIFFTKKGGYTMEGGSVGSLIDSDWKPFTTWSSPDHLPTCVLHSNSSITF